MLHSSAGRLLVNTTKKKNQTKVHYFLHAYVRLILLWFFFPPTGGVFFLSCGKGQNEKVKERAESPRESLSLVRRASSPPLGLFSQAHLPSTTQKTTRRSCAEKLLVCTERCGPEPIQCVIT